MGGEDWVGGEDWDGEGRYDEVASTSERLLQWRGQRSGGEGVYSFVFTASVRNGSRGGGEGVCIISYHFVYAFLSVLKIYGAIDFHYYYG